MKAERIQYYILKKVLLNNSYESPTRTQVLYLDERGVDTVLDIETQFYLNIVMNHLHTHTRFVP